MSPDGMPPRGEATKRTMAPTALPVSMPCATCWNQAHLHHYEAPHLTRRPSHPSPLPLMSQVPLPVAPPLAVPRAWILVQVGLLVGPLHVAPLPADLRVCLAPLPQGCLWLA